MCENHGCRGTMLARAPREAIRGFMNAIGRVNADCWLGFPSRSLLITEVHADAGSPQCCVHISPALNQTISGQPVYAQIEFNELFTGAEVIRQGNLFASSD